MNPMTFDENYGYLPKTTLTLIKRHNVSPADFDLMTDLLGQDAYAGNGEVNWPMLDQHIVSNSETGMYIGRYF